MVIFVSHQVICYNLIIVISYIICLIDSFITGHCHPSSTKASYCNAHVCASINYIYIDNNHVLLEPAQLMSSL